jgi:2-dehydropantoate 2-reductase
VPSIAVLGPGGVGGFLAGALAHAGEDVVVIARPETAELIAREGISVASVRLGDFVAQPAARPRLDAPADFLLVATKATALEEALGRVEAEPGLVVPLLNGLDHLATLRTRFGDERVAAGSIRIEADRPVPGRVVQTSPFLRVDLAADDPALHAALQRLKNTLTSARIPAEIGESEAQVMWSKLVRIGPLALTTSASDRPIGYVRTDLHWRKVLQEAIAETVAVATAEGAHIDAAATLAELDAAHPTLSSSMQRDIASGRPPELDAIPGAVLRAARRHGLECPTVEQLVAQIGQRAAAPRE